MMNGNKTSHTAGFSAPTADAQQEIWISSTLDEKASCSYNISCTIFLKGPYRINTLIRAIHQATGNHDALWAKFSNHGDYMISQESRPHEIPILDISALSAEKHAIKLNELLSHEISYPFILDKGPLWRATVVIISSQECRVLFTVHQIICDRWSLNELARDIGNCYSSIIKETAAPFSIGGSFFSYLLDIREHTKETQDFWVGQFQGQLPVLDLPLDIPRPFRRSYNGSTEIRMFDKNLVNSIKKQASFLGTDWFTLILGAFVVFLKKLSGESDLVIGIPAAGKKSLDHPLVFGQCENLLPFRVFVDPNVSFAALIQSVNRRLKLSFENNGVSLSSIFKLLRVQRDPSRAPLVSVGFCAIEDLKSEDLGFFNLESSFALNKKKYETFELNVTAELQQNGIKLVWNYNSDLFTAGSVSRWANEYEVLLRSAVKDASCLLRNLPILPPIEKELVLHQWNDTLRLYPADNTVVDLFQKCVNLFSGSIAVECNGRQLTYRELDNNSSSFAKYLSDNGVGEGSTLAICIDRSVNMLVALLGVLKSGAAYVPVDPMFPRSRISHIISDSNASYLITQSDLPIDIGPCGIPIVFIDEIVFTETLFSSRAKQNSLAYIIYTSGSTGKPKGVEICHKSLTNFLFSMQEKPGLSPHDTVLSVTTISFDIVGLELLLPLTIGAKVVIAESDIVADGSSLASKITSLRPALMQATPSTWTMLLEAGWRGSKDLTILCGGEALSRHLADRLLETQATVWNMYGPTETTIWSSMLRVQPGVTAPSVGYPIANTHMYILDETLQPVPIGVDGELCIAGFGLAKGYHNCPELTFDKFLPNPFADIQEKFGYSKIFKTGDIARRLADGSIVIAGRKDNQVKIRGFRIELGEIESTLLAMAEILECVVVDQVDSNGAKNLIAYIVYRNGKNLPVDVLQSYLRGLLPGYMIPSQFITLLSIPRLPNNKVNRSALAFKEPTSRPLFVPPNNDIEKALSSIWGDVLGNDNFGVLDNFFDLGGHSMAMVKVLSKIQDTIKITIELSELFDFPTIREFAQYLQKKKYGTLLFSSIVDRAKNQKKAFYRHRSS